MLRLSKRKKSSNPFDVDIGLLKKRMTLENNKFKGKMGEDSFRDTEMAKGSDVKRIHKGGDFIYRPKNHFTNSYGKPVTVEVKTGNARLSKAQKENKKRKGKNFREVRGF